PLRSRLPGCDVVADAPGQGLVYLCHTPFALPVKQRLVTTVEGLLQLFDQVGLPRHSKETLLVQTPLPDEVHTLLHQQGCQSGAKLLLILYSVL
uniref:Uncharacterized protein n=1 Tax=Lates calcarifer TaxID=8187 RepID=A0A4W6FDM6_LATCA